MLLKFAALRLLLLFAVPALAALSLATPSLATHGDAEHGACPETREFIEPYLHTQPEDGLLYERQREALRMHIDDILTFMGGIERAYAIAEATRDDAEEKIANGAYGAERRYHQDTILRADALIEILNCMTSTDDAGVGTERPRRYAGLGRRRNQLLQPAVSGLAHMADNLTAENIGLPLHRQTRTLWARNPLFLC